MILLIILFYIPWEDHYMLLNHLGELIISYGVTLEKERIVQIKDIFLVAYQPTAFLY